VALSTGSHEEKIHILGGLQMKIKIQQYYISNFENIDSTLK
jgi:hypothetical protein